MYCNFFGFSEKPFEVTPDPKFLYLSPAHRETLAALIYGIRERRGFITIVGEVGTGKTTLLNTVLDRLDAKTRAGFIFNTGVAFDEMLNMGLVDLGLIHPEGRVAKVEAVRRLNDFAIEQLSKSGNVVLLVDEAQNLDRSSMENLRLLSNLETRKHKLIQIVLSGQPELDVKLNQPELRQLNQRISLRRYITPLSEKETHEYIRHRLNMADYSGPALFDNHAQQLIWEYSGGVPRKINVLCDNALLIAYALRQKTIGASVIEEAIKDFTWTPFVREEVPALVQPDSGTSVYVDQQVEEPVAPLQPGSQGKTSRPRFARAASLVLAASVIFVVGHLLGTSRPILSRSELLAVWTSIRSQMPIHVVRPEQAPTPDGRPVSHEESTIAQEVAGSNLLQKKPESVDGRVHEGPPDQQASAAGPAGIVNQEPANQEPSSNETSESRVGEDRVVIVKRGDNLSRIILQAYGRYDSGVLSTVLGENPEIKNSDRILVGQGIKLPAKK